VLRELWCAFRDPGTVRELGAVPAGASTLHAVLAAVLDAGASIADPHGVVADADRAWIGMRVAGVESARFVVADGRLAPDFKTTPGAAWISGREATLVLQVDRLGAGPLTLRLASAGIAPRRVHVDGLHPDWLAPRGEPFGDGALAVNILLLDAARLVALPRSSRVEISVRESDAPIRARSCAPSPSERGRTLRTTPN